MNPKNNTELLHKEYLRSLNREKIWVRFYQILIFIFVFAGWEIASKLRWIDPLIFSSPSKVWALFIDKIQDGSLFFDLSFTLSETILGFILGTILGTLLAALLWWSPMLSKILDPY